MSPSSSKDGDAGLLPSSGTSITQRVARAAAVHPWRIVTAWGLALAASVAVIVTLFGSAFTSDGSLTTNPDSARAAKAIGDAFSMGDRIDEAVIIHSDDLTADSAPFSAFVADVRTSIEGTGATQTVRDPYAAHQ